MMQSCFVTGIPGSERLILGNKDNLGGGGREENDRC